MKKRKTYEISVIDKTYSKIISDETKFYTSDTALELGFELKETEYDFESAEIVLLNIDDRSLVTRPVSKVNNDFVYEIDDDITTHYGEWRGQLMLVEKGEVYVSSPIKFRIENDLYINKPLEITEVVSWVSLKKYANVLVDELKQAVDEAVAKVETMDETFKANELDRDAAEKERQSRFEVAESERDETFNTNEDIRQTQELEREQAESQRQTVFDENEANRTETFNANEATRQEDEYARIEAEKQREGTVAQIENRQDTVESKFDLLQQEITNKDIVSAPEIIAARGGLPQLEDRLNETDAQLAQTVKKGQNESITKAMLSQEIKNDLNNGEIDFRLNTSEIEDGAITQEKTNFIHKSSNLFNKYTVTDGYRLNLATGELDAVDDNSVSDFIEVEPGKDYYFKGFSRLVRFDENKNRINGNEFSNTEQIRATTNLTKYIRVSLRTSNLNVGQINKGSELLPYEPHLTYLSPEISISRKNIYDEETIEDDEESVNYMDKYSRLYKTELLPGRDRSADSGEMIAMFDELIGLNVYNGYQVERKLWGQDDFGNDLISYSATKTNMENEFGLERFKVGFLTGTHGNEKGPVVSLLYFLKDLLSNEKNNEMFDIVHSLVDFHWFPLVNPSGWDSNTRVNDSGVNINRNFTSHWEITNDLDKGPSPASEPETQAVESWMADNMFDILIDVHTTVDIDNSWFAADHTTDEGIGFIKDYYRTRSILSKWWGDREDVEFPKNTVMGHVNQYDSKLAQSWQHANEIGINTCLIELASRYTPDIQTDGPVTITFGTETIGNLMLETLKRKRVI